MAMTHKASDQLQRMITDTRCPKNLEYGPCHANRGSEQVCGQLGLLHAQDTGRWSPRQHGQSPRMAFGASNSSSMAISWAGC